MNRNTPYIVDRFEKGKVIKASSLNRLADQADASRRSPTALPNVFRRNNASSQTAIFKLTGGPTAATGYSYYTAYKCEVSDFATFTPDTETTYKVVFLRAGGTLPSGSSSYVNNTYVQASYYGTNSAGDEIWIADNLPGWYSLVAP